MTPYASGEIKRTIKMMLTALPFLILAGWLCARPMSLPEFQPMQIMQQLERGVRAVEAMAYLEAVEG